MTRLRYATAWRAGARSAQAAGLDVDSMSTLKSSARITRAVLTAAVTAAIGCAACAGSGAASTQAARSSRYEDLVALFADWRAFQKPHLTNGVPDYTAAAMTAQ